MQFITRKRRSPPAVIIVSLIDVLMVVLIFLMVTTTFRQQPAVKLTLPESSQAKEGVSEKLPPIFVDIVKAAPHLHFGGLPVTIEKLQEELAAKARANPQVILAIRSDTDAPVGQLVKVMDAAKSAKIKSVTAYTKQPGQR
ncbi:MAG: biopolymer transporter ExbD [Verrucomicrobia bacterium]|nr:biopolymer transporter ExbD [Verrucomicrobiota bacterium]